MKERLIVWDWNCTLLDDFKYINEATNNILFYFGNDYISADEHRTKRVEGVNNVLVGGGMSEEFIKENAYLIQEKFQAYYRSLAEKSRLRYGAKKVLHWAIDNGYNNIIVSNHNIHEIRPQARRLKLPISEDNIYSNGSHFNKSPKEEIFKIAIEGRDVDLTASVMVGDSLEEIRIGKKYGLKTFWISGGDYHYKDVKDYNPIPISNLTR
jgi:phosphoglycolate phosphatase-like HAD superfamily hydrolase